MQFESFKLLVETIKQYNKREKEMNKFIDSFNTCYTSFEFVPCFYDNIIEIVSKELNDENQWFEYWLNHIYLPDAVDENLTYAFTDNEQIHIVSIEEIYNFLTKRK